MKTILLNLFLGLFAFSFAQTPCVSNMAGSYPCNDYDLMSHFNKATLSSHDGSDIWGWTDALDNKEYALMTFEDKICFLDVTDPINPVYLGFVMTNAGTNYWRDVKVYNNTAYIVADEVGAHGVQVFDLERLRNVATPPENFAPNTVLTAGFGGSTIGSCHNIVINESVAMAYIVGCRSANDGKVMALDLSNRLNPVAVGQDANNGYSHDAQVVTYNGPDTDYTGKQIMVSSNEDEVVFLDVTDATNITTISTISYTNASYVHQGWFTEDLKYVLIGDEGDEQNFGNYTKTIIIDVTDLDNPLVHATYENPDNISAIDHNIYVKGNLAFEANYRSGMRVLDISDITNGNLTEVGYFDTYPASDTANFNGAWSTYPYFASGNIIISDIERGLFVVRKSGTLSVADNTLNPSEITIFPNPATTEIKVTSKNKNITQVALYNILGQEVLTYKNESNLQEITLDIKTINEGVYILKINNTIAKKIVINRL